MLQKLFATTAVAVAAIVGVVPPVAAETPNPLTFGIISTESAGTLTARFQPFLEDMGKALGVQVKSFVADDYAGIVDAMRRSEVDVAWMGNSAAVEAVDTAGGEVFAQSVDVSGNPGYWSVLIANKDKAGLNSLEDIFACDRTLRFGNGDADSTSGYLVPAYYVFAKLQIDPAQCFRSVSTANHENNAKMVANGEVDFATGNSESLSRLQKDKPAVFDSIKVIWRSPLIPSDPLVWRADLDREAKAEIKGFILTYGRLGQSLDVIQAEAAKLAKLSSGWAPFYDSSNAQLYPIRQLLLFEERTKLANDTTLDPAEKDAKVAAIDEKLVILGILAENRGAMAR
jgi:phosphonate transport system substrate-binding protein